MLTPSAAYSLAASWGSFMTSGDPGACFYGFDEAFILQSPEHRRLCLAYASDLMRDVRARPADFDAPRARRAELRRLKRALRAAPIAGANGLDDVSDFVRGYLDCAVWLAVDVSDEEGCNDCPDADARRLSKAAVHRAVETCDAFQAEAADLLAEAEGRGHDASQCGHDLYLTSGGHGAGFWDRSALDAGGLGDRLSKVARTYGDATLALGSDRMLDFM